MPSPKSTSEDLIFSKFSYGRIFETPSTRTKPPSVLPDGLRLITATMGTGIHYAIFCSQKVIVKGTRFGPYTGRLVKAGDVNVGDDNPQMWEVSGVITAQFCKFSFVTFPFLSFSILFFRFQWQCTRSPILKQSLSRIKNRWEKSTLIFSRSFVFLYILKKTFKFI